MANDEFIKIPKYFLIAGGLWPFKLTDKPVYLKFYKFYSRFQTISYMIFILSLAINLCILVIKHDQPSRMYSSVNIFIIVLEFWVKMLIFQIKKIPDMCSTIMKNEENVLKSHDQEIRKCYQQEVTYCRKVNMWQFASILSPCVLFALVSLLKLFATEDMSEFKNQPFMYDIWYPFRTETHMPLVVFINLGVVTQGLFFNTVTQTTFISLMIYSSARLKILQIRLRKFDKIAKNNYGGDVLRAIKEMIIEHQHLIQFVKSLNERTNYIMLMEFILNSLSLASGTIQIVMVHKASDLLSVCSIVLLVLFQIFILTWSANEICVESLRVADVIFASKWNEQNQEVQKLFMMMIVRAQKPLGITAGPFFQVTTNTALMTLKIAYSYLSLMMQNYEE